MCAFRVLPCAICLCAGCTRAAHRHGHLLCSRGQASFANRLQQDPGEDASDDPGDDHGDALDPDAAVARGALEASVHYSSASRVCMGLGRIGKLERSGCPMSVCISLARQAPDDEAGCDPREDADDACPDATAVCSALEAMSGRACTVLSHTLVFIVSSVCSIEPPCAPQCAQVLASAAKKRRDDSLLRVVMRAQTQASHARRADAAPSSDTLRKAAQDDKRTMLRARPGLSGAACHRQKVASKRCG